VCDLLINDDVVVDEFSLREEVQLLVHI
jgi:hypothetical protein